MGVVYLARDSVLEREVAYKVLPEGLRENPTRYATFCGRQRLRRS